LPIARHMSSQPMQGSEFIILISCCLRMVDYALEFCLDFLEELSQRIAKCDATDAMHLAYLVDLVAQLRMRIPFDSVKVKVFSVFDLRP
jgi:hypothetical protein